MAKLKVNDYWNQIFDRYNILNEISIKGTFEITATQIKEFKEPRLMTKFDHSKNRPKIFRDNHLSILPINNGVYLIGEFDLYKSLPSKDKCSPKSMSIPKFMESIDPDNIYSESNALNVALISGMIADVAGEDIYQTISGRMRANAFDFQVSTNKNTGTGTIHVEKPQIEIDGGYEGKKKIMLIEAKNTKPDDFIIRQLYYPYRFWTMKVDKEILPVFFTYMNGVYSFYVYKFIDLNNYSSIKLIKTYSYYIEYLNPNVLDPRDLIIEKEDHDTIFPQADTFNRVKETISLIQDEINTSEKIAEYFELSQRQGNYYLAAAKYIGLIKGHGTYVLTELGNNVLSMDHIQRNQFLVKRILSHSPFLNTYNYYRENNSLPSKKTIIQYMKDAKVNINGKQSVYSRRASTVKAWVTWIINSGIKLT